MDKYIISHHEKFARVYMARAGMGSVTDSDEASLVL
jgi:hypothetical protein